jgi:hypothetical protein
MFKSLYEKLKSVTDPDKIRLSVKFDGAPSVFVWNNFPGLQGPGIAIKALFAKNPKIMYNDEQIDHYYGEQADMARKLKYMLKYIKAINIPLEEIWQGDFLFDKHSLIREKNYVAFHPNTIVYKVPKDSDIGKKIQDSDVGVVWHTRYNGTSLEDISAKFNTKTTELTEHPNVFMTDPYIASLAGIVTLTDEEKSNFNENIDLLEELAENLYKDSNYNIILSDKELISLFNIFQNSLIRDNITIQETEQYVDGFKEFLNKRFKKEILLKKTEKSQDALRKRLNDILTNIQDNKDTFEAILTLILRITEFKNIFIKKLNNIGKFETFLETNEGKFIKTGDEGFAVSDIHGNVVKLVDRYEFSFANFSSTIKKGWTK